MYFVFSKFNIIAAIFYFSIDLFPKMSYNNQWHGAFFNTQPKPLIKAGTIIQHIYAGTVSLLFVTHFTGGIS